MAQSLFKILQRSEPGLSIDVLAPVWTRPVLERMPELREVLDLPLGHGELKLSTRYRIGRALRRSGYRHAYVLPNSLKSALVPYWARIPRRTGFVGEWRWGLLNDVRRLRQAALPMTVQRFAALAMGPDQDLPQPLPVPSLAVSADQVRATLSGLGLEPTGPVLALCPGAEFGPAKCWPGGHFAELARAKLEEGWEVWVLGSARDAASGAAIAAGAGPGCLDLTGRTSLGEAIDLLSRTSLVVSNDSGLMHVAAALDRPVIAIYGSSDPGFTPPLSQRARVERLALPCSPCFKRTCPLGHQRCLTDLTPARVLATMAPMLGDTKPPVEERG